MNKKLLVSGAFAVVAGFALTAFFGPTKADQLKEIEAKVKMGLEEVRTTEKANCDAKVAEAVNAKLAELAAATPEPAPAVAGKGGKKTSTKGPSAPKVPTPAPPPAPKANDVKTRGGAVQEGTNDVKKRGGAVQEGTQDVKKRGGAVKVEGGGK
jgi:hypothetical protein